MKTNFFNSGTLAELQIQLWIHRNQGHHKVPKTKSSSEVQKPSESDHSTKTSNNNPSDKR